MKYALEATVIVAVVLLSLRRMAFLIAALRRPRPLPRAGDLPSVAVLVPARNEQAVAGRLLAALSRLEYPGEQLSFVLVSDGSTDNTSAVFHDWARQRRNARVVELPEPQGKAAALNAALGISGAEIVVVVDADLAPTPGFLRELVRPFADTRVGAASAFLNPANADQNLVTRYAAVTTWVHQLVTSAGTDRLGFNPPTLGAAAYRRTALTQAGGFPLVPAGTDVATSSALTRLGWQTRFVRDAVADNAVVSTANDFLRQHIRWTRASFGTRPKEAGRPAVSLTQKIELAASSIGYADRVVFAVALVGAAAGVLPWWPAALYLAVPGLEIVSALYKAGAVRSLPRYLLAAVTFFAADVTASVLAVILHAADRPHQWHNPRDPAVVRLTES